MKITFLGAAEEVTGSKYLVQEGDVQILVDCGLFQGPKELTERNWDPFPADPAHITALVLTHAHIDHTGYIPQLVKKGFRGTIYCSHPTKDLCALLLMDSASLQESSARRINEHRSEGHGEHRPPVVPLYTVEDAEHSLHQFKGVSYGEPIAIGPTLRLTLQRSGHILGSSFVIISNGTRTISFSGDLGRPEQLILHPPTYIEKTDYLVLESTYGDRSHKKYDPVQALGEVISASAARGGKTIIPAFAVERTQEILYCLWLLRAQKTIPEIPIFLDSPLSKHVTDLFGKYPDEHVLTRQQCEDAFAIATYTPTAEDSKQIDQTPGPAIIIAGSGMADGGRVLYHLQRFIGDADTTVLFVGYQAQGTLGRILVEGTTEIKIHGHVHPVQAHIATIDTLSAHADAGEILAWLSHCAAAPRTTFLTHGDRDATKALANQIQERYHWHVVVPKYMQSYELD